MRIHPVLIFALALCGCDAYTHAPTPVEHFRAPGMEDMPFSTAVRVGETLYISGDVGVAPGTLELVEGGIQPETRQTMENIKSTLESFDASMDDIVKCTVFLADISEWGAMNEIYVTYFDTPPARSALGTSGLALGARVEIECIANIR